MFRLINRTIGCPRKKGPDRQREKDRDCLEISVARGRPVPLVFGIFLIRLSIWQGGSVSPDTSNYRDPKENGPDRQRKLERDFLEISVMSCRSMPLVVGFSLSV